MDFHTTINKYTQRSKDFELTAAGFQEWYYDCLPLNKHAKIIDVGCGDGKFLYFLKSRGYENVEGLEISTGQAQKAANRVGYNIVVTDSPAEHLRNNKDKYELITANDVLEHLELSDVIELLKAMKHALKDQGTIVISVPQVTGLRSLFVMYNDFTHKRLFTEESLNCLLEIAGFTHVRHIKPREKFRLTLRHITYRTIRFLWHALLKIISTIEAPGESSPKRFFGRLTVEATFHRYNARSQ